ncbi:MAG: anhydro-N-acetylmuramic acid kinase [Candidatus Marinimicrobia bacterium]|nr:anhydro-N-acetylmuramic acid kinase [Candidatus Neomarinimicrobiota bacterium]
MKKIDRLSVKTPLRVAGLMTGTSMDGLDICVADVSFDTDFVEFKVIKSATILFPSDLRETIKQSRSSSTALVCELNYDLGRFYAETINQFLNDFRIDDIDVVAMHGQTIHHTSGKATLQIGEPSFLAETLGVPVVSDFRARDISVGGTGAPLIPIVDRWLFQKDDTAIISLNIGGIANVTYLPSRKDGGEIIGFDTGPGMCLLDDVCFILAGDTFDDEGKMANDGIPDESLVEKWLQDPFVTDDPPKSTDREDFGREWLNNNIQNMRDWKMPDLLASLSLFTIRSIAVNCGRFMNLDKVSQIIVSGGGVHHRPLMAFLTEEFDPIPVITTREMGIDPDRKEALGFALLGAAYFREIPGNIPSVTGARKSVVLGKLTL